MSHLINAANQFKPAAAILEVREYGNGNINDTFLVTTDAGEDHHFILQRINTHVFTRPEHVMWNVSTVTSHMMRKLEELSSADERRWDIPCVVPAADGKGFWIDPAGSFWRALSFIRDAQSFDTIKDTAYAEETGFALGMFHYLVSDIPYGQLNDTLEGFHITPLYLRHYDEILSKYKLSKIPEVNYCLQFIQERKHGAYVLESAKEQGILPLRTIHGDPKINNIMSDINTGKAVSIIDLDTVKSGLIHYDIGDCMRSGCNPMGEETAEWESVRFETDIFRSILKGYLSRAKEFLTENDYVYFYESVRLLAFELGLRFFTDYLEGNVYFKAKHEEHNLQRALVQFRLTKSIEDQEADILSILLDMRI